MGVCASCYSVPGGRLSWRDGCDAGGKSWLATMLSRPASRMVRCKGGRTGGSEAAGERCY